MRTMVRKSLLYKSGVEYADYSLNHVEGCAHGCIYPCYAMMLAKRFGKIKTRADWMKPKLVKNALELLDKEIPRYKDDIKYVHLCFMTDPFMHKFPEVSDLTLKIIAKLNENGIRSTVLTKGILPKDLAKTDRYGSINEYGITLVSLDEKFRKAFEPNSAPFRFRIASLRRLHDAGLKTWVSMEPYPTPNLDKQQDLLKTLKSISFVDKIIFGKLNYNVKSSNFADNKGFYERCAETVVEFCKHRGIEYHIKYGTQIRDSVRTVKIFRTSHQNPRPILCPA
ncbi:MAG: radical SAM protein [Candidatus Aenigmatarchaeota archaeon]